MNFIVIQLAKDDSNLNIISFYWNIPFHSMGMIKITSSALHKVKDQTAEAANVVCKASFL